MIKNLLLLFSVIIIIIVYIRIILIYLMTKKIRIENITGFDLAKEITSNYNEINIVESKEINISKYNLRRNIIRLTNKNYDSNDIFTLAISTCLSGYSLTNINQDKYLKVITKVFSNIDYLGKSAFIAIIISLLTNTVSDAKIGIILLGILLIYQYLMIQITTTSNENVKKVLKKVIKPNDKKMIDKTLNIFLSVHTISFITTLILILREVLIILQI